MVFLTLLHSEPPKRLIKPPISQATNLHKNINTEAEKKLLYQ